MAGRFNEHGLTDKQEQFAQLVAKGSKLSDAYRTVYPVTTKRRNTVDSTASQLASSPKIAQRIKALRAPVIERLEREFQIDLNAWADQCARLAFADPAELFDANGQLRQIHDIPLHARMAISKVKVMREKTTTTADAEGNSTRTEESVIEYTLAGKAPVLDQLGRFLGAFAKDNRQKADATLMALLEFVQQRSRLPVKDITPTQQAAGAQASAPVGMLLPKE